MRLAPTALAAFALTVAGPGRGLARAAAPPEPDATEAEETFDLLAIPEELRDTTFGEDLAEEERSRAAHRAAAPAEDGDACIERPAWLAHLPHITVVVGGQEGLAASASDAVSRREMHAFLLLTVPLDATGCLRGPDPAALRRRAADLAVRQRALDRAAQGAATPEPDINQHLNKELP